MNGMDLFEYIPVEVATFAAIATADTWEETFPEGAKLHPRADHVIAVEGEALEN